MANPSGCRQKNCKVYAGQPIKDYAFSFIIAQKGLENKEDVDVLPFSSSFRSSFCLALCGRFFCILCSRKVQFLIGFSFLFCRLCLP